MKYTVSLEIERSRDEVIELFDSTENLKKWMPSLLSFEHLSGEPGKEGATSRMMHKMRGKETEMIETITKRDFPNAFHATYEAKGVFNVQENYFTEIANGRTLWKSDCEFIGTGFMMKAMMFLMPGAFKKESLKYMERFKTFAENK